MVNYPLTCENCTILYVIDLPMGKAIATTDVQNAHCPNCKSVGKSHLSRTNELFPEIRSIREMEHQLSDTVKMYEQSDKESPEGHMLLSRMTTLLWVLKRT